MKNTIYVVAEHYSKVSNVSRAFKSLLAAQLYVKKLFDSHVEWIKDSEEDVIEMKLEICREFTYGFIRSTDIDTGEEEYQVDITPLELE